MKIPKLKSFNDVKRFYEALQETQKQPKQKSSKEKTIKPSTKSSDQPAVESTLSPQVVQRSGRTAKRAQIAAEQTAPVEATVNKSIDSVPLTHASQELVRAETQPLDMRLRRNKDESLLRVITTPVRQKRMVNSAVRLEQSPAQAIHKEIASENLGDLSPSEPIAEIRPAVTDWWERAKTAVQTADMQPTDLLMNVRQSISQRIDVAQSLHNGLSPDRVMDLYSQSADPARLQQSTEQKPRQELFGQTFSQISDRFDRR